MARTTVYTGWDSVKELITNNPCKRLKIISNLKTLEWGGRNTFFQAKCLDCGHKFETNTYKLQDSIRRSTSPICPICSKKQQQLKAVATRRKRYGSAFSSVSRKSFTPAQYAKILKPRKLKPLEDYSSMDVSIKHQCLVCTHVFKNSPGNIIKQRNGCSKCAGKHKKTSEEYAQELIDIGSKFRLKGEYLGARIQTEHTCTVCNFTKLMTPTNALRGDHFCHKCHGKLRNYKRHTRTFGDREVSFQGFNHLGMDWLLDKRKLDPSEIITEYEKGIPTIHYRFKGKRRHYPDLYVPKRKLIVEVKSDWTLSLCIGKKKGYAEVWYQQIAKYKSAIKQGYKYQLLVFDQNFERIKLPKNWYEFGYREILSYIYE